MMITAALLFIPFIAGIILFFVKSDQAKKIALFASLAELALAVFAFFRFDKSLAQAQFATNIPWVKSLGINFSIAMDGISLLLVLLSCLLLPLIVASTKNESYKNSSTIYALMLLMQFGLIGVFTAQDAFLFYVFWEIALIPIYFIALLWGGAERVRITFKFFIYTLFGSLLMLTALIYIYFKTPAPHTFNIASLYNLGLSVNEQNWIFIAFFIAFAIKMPVFPFHSWLADTYTDAPIQGTMLLSGIMSKMGVYGAIRLLLPIAPLGFNKWGFTVVLLAVIGVVFLSFLAVFQKNYKRLLAYSSAAHLGLIGAGVFALNHQGISGAVIQMFAHGISAFGLFYILDLLNQRTGTSEISQMGGIRLVAPQFATYALIILLSSIALPLTSGFVGEFLLLAGIYQYHGVLAAIGGLTTILGAVYMLRSYQAMFLGDQSSVSSSFVDLNSQEKIILIPVVILIFLIGVYPSLFMDIAEPAVKQLTSIIQLAGN